jgi:hypothetical protein
VKVAAVVIWCTGALLWLAEKYVRDHGFPNVADLCRALVHVCYGCLLGLAIVQLSQS